MAKLPDQSLPRGAHIGVYEIKDVIRSDSLGYTYRAWNEHLNTYVSLKEYFPGNIAVRADDGESILASTADKADLLLRGLDIFQQQADILSTLQHPNIISVHNVLQHNNTAYIAMDDELGVVLSSTKNKRHDKENIFRALVDALKHIHEKGTVHGDLHPKAILVDSNGQAKLIEFAAARIAFAALSNALEAEIRPGYSAAELSNNQQKATAGSDIYALGATMYRFITQKEPKSALARLQAYQSKSHDPLPAIFSLAGPATSKGFLNTVNLMLSPDSSQRPQSCADILQELNQQGETESDSASAQNPPSQSASTAPGEEKSSTATWLGPAAVIVVLLGLGFWFIAQPGPDAELNTLPTQTQATSEQEAEVNVAAKPETLPTVEQDIASIETPETTAGSGATQANALDEQTNNTPDTVVTQQITATAEAPVTTPEVTEVTEVTDNAMDVVNEVQEPPSTTKQTSRPELPIADTQKVSAAESMANVDSSEPQQQINDLISDAEAHIAEFKLTTPTDSNAYDQYQAILEIDPDNPQADGGLQQIVDKYVWLINKAIRTKQPRLARVYLKRALKVAPQDPELLALAEKLETD